MPTMTVARYQRPATARSSSASPRHMRSRPVCATAANRWPRRPGTSSTRWAGSAARAGLSRSTATAPWCSPSTARGCTAATSRATGSSAPRSTTSRTARCKGSRLRLRGRPFRPPAAVVHELIEFGLVLGVAQPVQELEEIALLVFEPPQCLGAIFVEGAVAARRPLTRRPLVRTTPPAGAAAHLLHALLHALHASPPAAVPAMCPASHATTPYQISENHQPGGPEQDEADDHQPDPGRFTDVVQTPRDRHGRSPHVNVYYIHILSASRPVKRCPEGQFGAAGSSVSM